MYGMYTLLMLALQVECDANYSNITPNRDIIIATEVLNLHPR